MMTVAKIKMNFFLTEKRIEDKKVLIDVAILEEEKQQQQFQFL